MNIRQDLKVGYIIVYVEYYGTYYGIWDGHSTITIYDEDHDEFDIIENDDIANKYEANQLCIDWELTNFAE